MDLPNCDLEDLWQAVRLRFERRRSLNDRLRWGLYSRIYRLVRAILVSGIRA